MTLRILTIDAYGYNGRDYHPTAADEGLVVVPVGMTSLVIYNGGEADEVLTEDERIAQPALPAIAAELEGDDDQEHQIVRCWRCVTEDGRLLDLMDHEVELFES